LTAALSGSINGEGLEEGLDFLRDMRRFYMKEVQKATVKLHPRDARSAGNPDWRARISQGMRRNKARREASGLLTLRELATERGLPLKGVVELVEAGALEVLQMAGRSYVTRQERERVFGRMEESAA
jgi:hypothetical protein